MVVVLALDIVALMIARARAMERTGRGRQERQTPPFASAETVRAAV